MVLSKLAVYSLRNIAALELSLSEGNNFIVGPNGAGKSSLLEAIYLLTNGKSFRGGYRQSMIKEGQTGFRIKGKFLSTEGIESNIVIAREGRERRIAVNNTPVKNRSELLRGAPLLLFSQETLSRQVDSAAGRRSMLDWCLFHVEQPYHLALAEYRSVLGQYNAGLRKGVRAQSEWMQQLAKSGETIDFSRQGIVKKIEKVFLRLADQNPELPTAYLEYRHGWRDNSELLAELNLRSADDARLGYSTLGPHRADLRIRSDRGQILHWASRGQVKAYYYLLFISLLMVVAEETGEKPITLVDDLWAEVDEPVARFMVGITSALGGQALFTASRAGKDIVSQYNMRSFHVEHGVVIEAKPG